MREFFKIHIVKQAYRSPIFDVFTEFFGISPHRDFHGKTMLEQHFAGHVLAQYRPGFLSSFRHSPTPPSFFHEKRPPEAVFSSFFCYMTRRAPMYRSPQ